MIVEKQRRLSFFRDADRQPEGRLAVRRNRRHVLRVDSAFLHNLSVTEHLPGNVQVVFEIRKVHVIVQCKRAGVLVEGCHPRRAVDVFVFQQSGVDAAVGVDQTVHTEVTVVRELIRVAAVGVNLPSVRRGTAVDGMVAPFPDKSSAGAVVFFHQTEVVFQVARAVAHGVTVFT